MALAIQSTSLITKEKHSVHLLPSRILIFPTQTRFTVKSTTQSSSSASSSSSSKDPKPANGDTQEKKPNRTGLGFGPPSSSSSSSSVETRDSKKKQRSRERASVIRRSPVEKPAFLTQKGGTQVEKQSKTESAFLLTWLGLGCVILIEGLTLSASGFLPEEWDKFLVKYLYPVFTPTVFFFVAGTVVYGVLKYMQGEKTER